MKWSFHTLRIRALQILTRTVKPSLPLGGYLMHALAFDSASEAARFILACGGVLEELQAPAGAGEGGGQGPPPQHLAPEFRLVLDCKASAIERVREVTQEERVFKDGGLTDYLKAAVAAAPAVV